MLAVHFTFNGVGGILLTIKICCMLHSLSKCLSFGSENSITYIALLEMLQVRSLVRDKNYPELIEHSLTDPYDVNQLTWVIQMAFKCLRKDPNRRISVDQVRVSSHKCH